MYYGEALPEGALMLYLGLGDVSEVESCCCLCRVKASPNGIGKHVT
jgi:hypothetical protein